MNNNERKVVYTTNWIFNEVDWVDFFIEIVETSENNYSINLLNELWDSNLFFNLSLKEILDDFCELVEQRVWKYWFEKTKLMPIYQMVWPIAKIIEEIIAELRMKQDNSISSWLDLDDIDYVENELIATVDESEFLVNEEPKTETFWVDFFNSAVNFKETFKDHKIWDLNINSIYVNESSESSELKIMTSNWWNKKIQWGEIEALQVVLDYVEALSEKFTSGQNVQEVIAFTYANERKWMNLIWIHWDTQDKENKKPVFEEFFTVVWLDWKFNKTTFGHWMKKNFFENRNWSIAKIQFRA